MRLRLAFAKVGRDLGSKMIYPAAHGLIGDHDPTLGQQIFYIPEPSFSRNIACKTVATICHDIIVLADVATIAAYRLS